MRSSRALISGLVSSLALLPSAAWATTPTETLRPALEEVIRILEDPSLKPEAKARERQARLRAAVVDLIDFPEMGRRALGRHWQSLTPAQREEFVSLFRALIEHTYLPKIALYQGERVRFAGESVDRDLATVQTVVIAPDGKEIPTSYRLHTRSGQWVIYDISIEGISLVSNYRSQFDQIIQRGSYQDLVKRIKQKLTTPL